MLKFFLLSLVSAAAFAGPLATVNGNVILTGVGCPKNSFSVTTSPDKTDLSILFDSYRLSKESGAAAKNCLIRVPVSVKAGYRLKLKSSDYRGFVFLPKKANSNFFSEAIISTKRGTTVSKLQVKRNQGEFEEDFTLNSQTSVTSAQCGGNIELWFFSLASLTNVSRPRELADFTIDSFDFSLSELSDRFVTYTPCK